MIRLPSLHRAPRRAVSLASLLLLPLAGPLGADELYREDFNANGVVSKVGWAVWHRDATSGLIIDDTAKASGDRVAVFTSYAGKPISHVYSSINADNSPTLLFTTEFSFDLRHGSITSFSVGRFFQDTPSWATDPTPDLNTLQLALRVDDQWYVRSETIVAARDASSIAYDTGVAPAAEIGFSFSGWAPLDFSLGSTPSLGSTGSLPVGLIDAFGFYLVAYDNTYPGYGTTRERIDYVTIQGAISPVPEPATWAAACGALALIGAGFLRRRRERL
jgi:hypothetical protein